MGLVLAVNFSAGVVWLKSGPVLTCDSTQRQPALDTLPSRLCG